MADWDADEVPNWAPKWPSQHEDDDSFQIPFLHGPIDSFNYLGPGWSAEPSRRLDETHVAPIRHVDFISLVTAISHAYRRDKYLEMRKLDGLLWDDIDAGSVFQVSRSQIRFQVEGGVVRSDTDGTGNVVNRVVIKRVMKWSMSATNVRSFTRELHILDHMRDVDNIVRLRGVGWFYNGNMAHPIPEPVLMLEEAQHTLQHLVASRVAPVQLLVLFHDIASGLSALHDCDIVHGDIKPPNVLLFAVTRLLEGVEVPAFTAKLSDFSLSVLDNGRRQSLPGGTHPYMAPEYAELLDFAQLKLTDVYSLGMLVAVVAAGTEALPSLEATDLLDMDLDLSDLPSRIMQRADIDAQGSTLPRSQIQLFEHIFKTTLRTDPTERDLPGLLRTLEDAAVGQQRVPTTTESLYDPSPAEVKVTYAKFASLSTHIMDHITTGLLKIHTLAETDPRYAQACFELGVIYTSKLGGPRDSPIDGLRYLRASAEKGDLRARALYGRLLSVYGGEADADYRSRRLDWLYSAAQKGYRIAQEELANADSHMAKKARSEYALACVQAEIGTQLQVVGSSTALNNPSLYCPEHKVHIFAATGALEALLALLDEHPNVINSKSLTGDTPLLTACRYGQFESATALLSHAAVDASMSNQLGENPLHFMPHFDRPQAETLVLQLLPNGADPDQEATAGQNGPDWDLSPRLAGTPIEYAALRGRLDLVKLFLERGCLIVPRNGNQLRRMLLLAFRTQHTDLQRFLIDHASPDRNEPRFRQELHPLRDTVWVYKGQRLSYLEAGVLGWVRHTGATGLDVPLSFWQACYHGPSWRTAMQETVENALELACPYQNGPLESLLDRAVILSMRERAYDAFQYLLEKKIVCTDGNQGRLKSLEPMCWRKSSGVRHETKGVLDDRAHDEEDGAYNDGGAGLGELQPRPVQTIRYVDQIYRDVLPHRMTLAQHAVWIGDRTLFSMLVNRYGANITLPFHGRGLEGGQHNCYSALAFTSHQDMWFTYEFYDLGAGIYCPFDRPPSRHTPWNHPLLTSIQQTSSALVNWLARRGATVFDGIGYDTTVLDRILAVRPRPQGVMEFMFPLDDPERRLTWWVPSSLEVESDGYRVFHAVASAMRAPRSTERNHTDSVDCARMAGFWVSLFDEYPNVENWPVDRRRSLIHWSRSLFAKHFRHGTSSISFGIFLAPSVDVTVTISESQPAGKRPRIRLILPSASHRRTQIKFQTCRRFVQFLTQGSPLDDMPLAAWFHSRLWMYGYFPSMGHPTLTRYRGKIFNAKRLFVYASIALGPIGLLIGAMVTLGITRSMEMFLALASNLLFLGIALYPIWEITLRFGEVIWVFIARQYVKAAVGPHLFREGLFSNLIPSWPQAITEALS